MPRCKHLVILKPASPTEPKEVTCKLNVLKRENSVKRLCTGCKSFTLKKARPKLASRKKTRRTGVLAANTMQISLRS